MSASPNRHRNLGSIHAGTGHFWIQRVTAIANVPLMLALIVLAVAVAGRSHAAVLAALSQPAIGILLLAALLSAVIHMRVGMQVIIEDYVQREGWKVLLLMANSFFSIGIGLAAAFAILRLSFGL